jgi:hypothetical protein
MTLNKEINENFVKNILVLFFLLNSNFNSKNPAKRIIDNYKIYKIKK